MTTTTARDIKLVMDYCAEHVSGLTRRTAAFYLNNADNDAGEAIQRLLSHYKKNENASFHTEVMSHRAVREYLNQQENVMSAIAVECGKLRRELKRAHVIIAELRKTNNVIGKLRGDLTHAQDTIYKLQAKGTRDAERIKYIECCCKDHEDLMRKEVHSLVDHVFDEKDAIQDGAFISIMNRARAAFKACSLQLANDDEVSGVATRLPAPESAVAARSPFSPFGVWIPSQSVDRQLPPEWGPAMDAVMMAMGHTRDAREAAAQAAERSTGPTQWVDMNRHLRNTDRYRSAYYGGVDQGAA